MIGNSRDFLLGVVETIMNNGYKNIILKIYNKSRDFPQTSIEMKGNIVINLQTLIYPVNKITQELVNLYELKEAYELIGKPDIAIQKRIKKLENKLGEGIEKIIVEAIKKDYPFEYHNGQEVKGSLNYELKPKNIINICNALSNEEVYHKNEQELDVRLDEALSF